MSRGALVVGLVVSLGAHAWVLLSGPDLTLRTHMEATEVVGVVELPPERPEVDQDVPEPAPPLPALDPPSVAQSEPEPPGPAPSDSIQDPPETPKERELPQAPNAGLREMAKVPSSPVREPGDLRGVEDAPKSPALRIDWGLRAQALSVLDAGDMQLAVLNSDASRPVITHQIQRRGDTWRRSPYRPSQSLYSNRLRVVDDVPAFQAVRQGAGLIPRERLVVLVPTKVERMLESAQLAAAFSRGLPMDQIRDFGGCFTVEGQNLAFKITHVRAREPGR